MALIELDAKELLADIYEQIEKDLFKEMLDKAEPLPKAKTCFDVLMEAAKEIDEEKIIKVLAKIK